MWINQIKAAIPKAGKYVPSSEKIRDKEDDEGDDFDEKARREREAKERAERERMAKESAEDDAEEDNEADEGGAEAEKRFADELRVATAKLL